MVKIIFRSVFLLLFCGGMCNEAVAKDSEDTCATVNRLFCKGIEMPIGVTGTPIFGWHIDSDRKNYLRSAYEIELADDSAFRDHVIVGGVTDTDTVMVIGCGMIGLGAIVRASLRGAKVIAVDIDEKKLKLAKRLGASYALDSRAADFRQQFLDITNNDGPNVVIEAVGSPFTYTLAVNEVAFAGRVVCIGYSAAPVTFQTKLFVQKELDIRGSRNALPEDFEAVKRYLKRGECPVDSLISAVIKPEEAAGALNYWKDHRGDVFRILVDFS